MIEFDDSDQLDDGELEPVDTQELAQKRSHNDAVEAFVEAFVGAANAAANDIIDRVAKDPQIKVDRRQFLQQQFANSPCLDEILLHGPQSVYELEMLAQKAQVMVCSEAEGISAAGVSIRHYEFWIHVVRMVQQILYLFGEDELPDDAEDLVVEIKKHADSYQNAISSSLFVGGLRLIAQLSKYVGEAVRKRSAESSSMKLSVSEKGFGILDRALINQFQEVGFRLIDELMDAKRGGAESGTSSEHR